MCAKSISKPRPAQHPNEDRFDWDPTEPGLGIRHRPNRKPTWHLQIRIDGKTVRRSLGAVEDLSRAEAILTAREMRDRLTNKPASFSPAPVISKTTMADFAGRYLQDGAPNWKPTTLRSHRYVINRFILPAFGSSDLASLTAQEVAAWWTGLDACAGTRNRTLAVLSGLIRHAELLGLRSPGQNPCQGLRRRKSDFKVHRLTREDYQKLGEALKQAEAQWPVEAALIRFLALTGCRKSEARLLRWDMIDGSRAALPDSKTGPRAIWLGTPVLKWLAELPALNDYVFTRKDKPVSNYWLDKVWHRIREQAGLPKLRLHDLRHGFASAALSSGEALRTVSGLLGHSDLKTTAGYAWLAEASVRGAAERVAAHLGKALGAHAYQEGKEK